MTLASLLLRAGVGRDPAPATSMPGDLTDNFYRREVSRSELALRLELPNEPNEEQWANAKRLASTLLEPTRLLLGERPMHVNSWFRSPLVNRLVGGVPNSSHLEALACDFYPIGLEIAVAFEAIRRSGLVFDQLIHERSWIHLSLAAFGKENRRMAFRIP